MGEGGTAFSSPNGFLKKGVVSLEEAIQSLPALLTCRFSINVTPGGAAGREVTLASIRQRVNERVAVYSLSSNSETTRWGG